ncbi:hypothetical protein H4J45_18280 [Colwellia sp. BRX10-6]|uniref:MalM family protein n=1 Tax=unclassified Colwellia TaxID=196834 RepID=UPI0015F52F66|nr:MULTISPECIES: MalM family protein [unclassified Colwellia]MBA6385190.1 hypothetical protein [Colwellia sp. BRX10-9]MBA6396032.1 hypothetical protein [Colwellia sp. BRX10-6]
MLAKGIIIFLGLALLVSCAQPNVQITGQYLYESEVCCTQYPEMNFEELSLDKRKSFKIWTDSPSFKFKSGKSFFKGYKLPQISGRFNVNLKSVFRRDVFFPIITILDKEYEVVRTIAYPTIDYHPPEWSNGYVGGEFLLNLGENERYMIIHTPTEMVGDKIDSKGLDTVSFYTGGGFVFFSGLNDFEHLMSHIGNLSIKLERM